MNQVLLSEERAPTIDTDDRTRWEEVRFNELVGGQVGSEPYCACMRKMITEGPRIADGLRRRVAKRAFATCDGPEDQRLLAHLLESDDDVVLENALQTISGWLRSEKGASKRPVLIEEFDKVLDGPAGPKLVGGKGSLPSLTFFALSTQTSSPHYDYGDHELERARRLCATISEQRRGGFCGPKMLKLEGPDAGAVRGRQ